MIPAGNLNEILLFERKTVDLEGNPNGDISETWNPLLTTRASVKMMSAEEQINAGKLISEGRVLIHMRYRKDLAIEAGDRVTWRGQTWIVESGIEIDQRRSTIKLTADIVSSTSNISNGTD